MNVSQQLSVIAYFLSKYDKQAVDALQYGTTNNALHKISELLGKGNAYLKLRRDEFDVVTGSHRKGWRNRKPAKSVVDLATELDKFSFEDMIIIVADLLSNNAENQKVLIEKKDLKSKVTEEEIETFLNQQDSRARLHKVKRERLERLYNTKIVDQLKKHYGFKCQICGHQFRDEYGVDIAEAHHLAPFSISENNDSDNLIILCPNHHRLLHALNAEFDRETKEFHFTGGTINVEYNYHL